MPITYDEELDKDIDNNVEDDDYKKKQEWYRDIIGRKPFALDYVSLLGDKKDDDGNRVVDKENVAKIIEILKDETFQNEYPYAGEEAKSIVSGLSEVISEDLTYEEASAGLKEVQNAMKKGVDGRDVRRVSYKTRARLARQLSKVGGCDFDVEVRKIPDMRWLVPANYLANYKDGKWKRDRYVYQNMPPRDGESGFVVPEYKKMKNGVEVNLALEVADRLQNRLDELMRNESNLSGEYIEFYKKVIAAYRSGKWENIAKLNEAVTTMDAITAAFDIRKAAANPLYAPDYYYPEGTILKVRHKDRPDPKPHLDDKILTSDEWNQSLMATDKEAEFLQRGVAQGVKLAEGIVVTALEQTLGKEFKRDEFGEMILDSQEEYIINSMNAAQRAKFNALVVQGEKQISEMLPPNALVLIARGTDKTLATDKKMSANEKTNLESQRRIVLEAMMHQVELYDGKQTIVNLENVAGVYDGAMSMIEYLRNNYNIDPKTGRPVLTSDQTKKLNNLESMLNTKIGEYDKHEKLDGVDDKSVNTYTDNLEKIYKEQVDDTISKGDFETRIAAIDSSLKADLWDKLDFEDSIDPDGNPVKGEDVKKTFAEVIMLKAAQRAAAESVAKPKAKLEDLYTQNLEEVLIEEAGCLLAAQSATMTVDQTKPLKDRKQQIISYLQSGSFKISKDAQAGYFAKTMNSESLFVNRLANKFKNRSAKILFKIHDRFQKIDNTLIKRYGAAYQIPRTVVANSARNLPWTAANAVARIAAFTQVGTPWGMACIAGYAAFNIGVTAVRMRKNYKENKAVDSSLTPWKYIKRNWSAIGMTLVGTALTTIPGLSHGAGVLQNIPIFSKLANASANATGFMTTHHMLDVTPKMNPLGMTNASMGLLATGGLDSFLRGVKANRRSGDKFWSAVSKALTSTSLSTVFNVGTGVAISQTINHFADGVVHYNPAGDIKDTHDTVKDDSFLPGSPNHDPDANYSDTSVSLTDVLADLSPEDQSQLNSLIDNAKASNDIAPVEKFLNDRGYSISEVSSDGDVVIPGRSGYNPGAVEHAAEVAADWQKDVPGLHDANIRSITECSTINDFNSSHPTMQVDPNRMEMLIMLSGGMAVSADADTHVNVDYQGQHHDVNGNHGVLTEGWVNKYGCDDRITEYLEGGITKEDIAHLRSLHDQNGNFQAGNVTERDLKVLNALDHFVSDKFAVGDIEATRGHAIDPKYLPSNAIVNESGEHVESKNGRTFNTYANGQSARNDVPGRELAIEGHTIEKQYVMPLGFMADLYIVRQFRKLAKIMGNNGLKKEGNRGFEDIKPGEERGDTGSDKERSDSARKKEGKFKPFGWIRGRVKVTKGNSK